MTLRASVVLAVPLVAAAVAALPRPAEAHHVVSDNGIAPVMPQTVASVDLAAASFDLSGVSGEWQSVTPSVEIGLHERISLFAALPIAQVSFDEGGDARGLGDASASVKAALYASPHGGLLVSAGLGAELPTGDEKAGLGGGHVGLAPFLAGSSVLLERGGSSLLTHALAAVRFGTEGGGHHHGSSASAHLHGSAIAPHADRELAGRAMLVAVHGTVYAGVGAEGAAALGAGGDHLAARLELGAKIAGGLRLFVAGDATVAGERRFGLRGRSGAAWIF